MSRRATLAGITALVLLPSPSRADRQTDPELRGVIAAAIEPSQCFVDRYEQEVWFAYMDPRLARFVKDPEERRLILHHVHCEARQGQRAAGARARGDGCREPF